jgi:4-amino-4-deoxy-L-arabinose transferase-like glycosyltransferase
MKIFLSTVRRISRWQWVLVGIIIVGIFFRVYHFHDFLRFNADQSRDATVVSEYLDGTSPLPLLGPKAGGTDFRVGPAFYYFQIVSAKLFGDAPDVVAYPDLLFSILAIPLLFLFLRKYFDRAMTLLLVAIFAVSFYVVWYSRFAWNPNSLPFWTLLFLIALHGVAVSGLAVKRWQVVLLGVALGIGVQLHTLSLLFLPFMTIATFGLLVIRKQFSWKSVFLVFAVAMILNIPQIASEIRTGGENTAAFFHGVGVKEKKGSGIAQNIAKDVVCHVDAVAYMLSSYEIDDGCSLKSVTKRENAVVFFGTFIVVIGGCLLAFRAFRREQDMSKKYFLGMVFFYLGFSFLVLLPLANEISMRFFLVVIFMPFFLLGLCFEYLREKFPRQGYRVAILMAGLLIIAHVVSLRSMLEANAAYLSHSNAGMDNILLKEVELSSAFIVAHAGGAPVVAVDGDARYLFKGLKSMNYLTRRSGIKLVEKNKKTDPTFPVFLIENTKRKNDILENMETDAVLSFGRFTIFALR